MTPMRRLLLVDDHALVRRGLASLLATEGRFVVVAEAGSGEQALELVPQVTPDVVILDMSLPGIDGLETLRRLRRLAHPPRILILSMHDEAHLVAQAFQDGADGYLLKDSMDDELFQAIEVVCAASASWRRPSIVPVCRKCSRGPPCSRRESAKCCS